MLSVEHTQSLTDFREKSTETLDRLHRTGEAEILTVDGQARAVILSPAAYDEMAREVQAAAHRRALQQHAEGDSMELHAFMDSVRAQLLAMRTAQPTSNGASK